jgi:hypothetical protein
VRELTARLEEFRSSLRGVDNQAVFEIPRILGRILDAPLSRPELVPHRIQGAVAPLARPMAVPRGPWYRGEVVDAD